ncbi:GPI ethanolamine phosphate transferase 3-like [Argiope bruennichi]|uniref:GPI ethanolamine phosphate transferase 3-like n=1 Tax=Argiope bruennichi TaxID=94029 RepID=UPI0024954186|nr:GPI ethanolamine phosphate transferase 3-like [Argiope bruennichi]
MSLKNCLIVLWVYILYVLGIWFFLSGYLLKRIVVHQNSTVTDSIGRDIDCKNVLSLRHMNFYEKEEKIPQYSKNKNYLKRFDRAIIIVIDALRFDFVLHHPEDTGENFYLNKMPVFKEIMEKNKNNALLFRLTADPPTTTLQRLKGLTTGSLPTFIDLSLNFASSEISEDNFIRQMNKYNKRIVFMGDDTWDNLFPNAFHRKFPFPSFNVKDLDTVDDGILKHLYDEMEKNDSEVIIAHFLGVDHCGHRYGPKHPEMSRKLQQMNSVIQNITEKLKNDTILLVLGDHGMTESGDHGGDSTQEISTALFLYSQNKLTNFKVMSEIPTVAQVDIVPTLSLLLGLPIPFSNLGKIITPLFVLNFKETCFDEITDSAIASALAGAENAFQVQKYLHAYNEISNELSDSFMIKMEKRLKDATHMWKRITNNITENRNILSSISESYKSYLDDVRNTCSKKWATFNLKFIILGIFILCFTVLWNLWFSEKFSITESIFVFVFIMLLCFVGSLYKYNLFNFYTWCVLGLIILIPLVYKHVWNIEGLTLKYLFCIISLLIAMIVISIYIFMDYLIIFGCFITIFVYFLIICLVKLIPSELYEFIENIFSIPFGVVLIIFCMSFSNSFVVNEDHTVLFLVQSMIIYRFFPSVIECITTCFSSNNNKTKPSKKSIKGIFKYLIQPLCLVCLIFFIRLGSIFYKCREEQTACENSDIIISFEKLHLNQSHKFVRLVLSLASEIIPALLFLGIMSYKYCIKSQTVSAVCVKYGIFFVCIMTSLRWWLNIVPSNIVDRILKGNEVILTRAALLTSIILFIGVVLFPILSERPWEVPSKEIYSSSFTSVLFILLQILFLVAGDALSPAVMLMSFSLLLFVILIQLSFDGTESHLWTDTIILSLLARHWFYATAHQPTFTSIQWDAAFLLNHKEIHSYTLSGALVVINTFSSFIFHALALSSILIMRDSFYITSHSILRLHMKYLLCFGVKLLGTVIASFILRRHLMVWKIFSPKLIYEVIAFIITMLSSVLSHYFIIRIMSLYHKCIRTNLNQMFSSKDQ